LKASPKSGVRSVILSDEPERDYDKFNIYFLKWARDEKNAKAFLRMHGFELQGHPSWMLCFFEFQYRADTSPWPLALINDD
jgi:hypothetical protein